MLAFKVKERLFKPAVENKGLKLMKCKDIRLNDFLFFLSTKLASASSRQQ